MAFMRSRCRADRSWRGRVGAHAIVALLLRDRLREREHGRLGRRIRGNASDARAGQRGLGAEEDDRAFRGSQQGDERARGEVGGGDVDRELPLPRRRVAVRDGTTRAESSGEMDQRVDSSGGGVAHAGGERLHRRRVGQIGAERGGAQPSGDKGFASCTCLALLAIDEEHSRAAFGERPCDGLTDLTFASNAGEHHAATREFHANLHRSHAEPAFDACITELGMA